jgi:anti-sigma factor RsiW
VIGRRTHNPQRDTALYVTGEMRPSERGRFEAHLLRCDDCWREVSLGREGRGMAEASREIATPGLRDEIRAAISLAPVPRRLPRRLALVAVVSSVLAVTIVGAAHVHSVQQPPPIAAALAAARTETLSARGPSEQPAPNLSSQGLELVMGERVDLAGLTSDAFMYRNTAGEAVLLFTSATPFPVAHDATPHAAGVNGWTAQSDGMTLVCGDRPMNYLVIAHDLSLVGLVERGLISEPTSS